MLRGISVDETGVVTASYSNGEMTPLYQIALVDFPSYDGLERGGVADEAVVDEDTRAGDGVLRVEAQLHLLAGQFAAHLEAAASLKPDRTVVAHRAAGAMQEEPVEFVTAGGGLERLELG